MVEIRQRQPPNHSVSLMLGISGSTATFICAVLLSYLCVAESTLLKGWLWYVFAVFFSVPL